MFSVFYLIVKGCNIFFPVPPALYRIEAAIGAELAAERDMYIYASHLNLFQQEVCCSQFALCCVGLHIVYTFGELLTVIEVDADLHLFALVVNLP